MLALEMSLSLLSFPWTMPLLCISLEILRGFWYWVPVLPRWFYLVKDDPTYPALSDLFSRSASISAQVPDAVCGQIV